MPALLAALILAQAPTRLPETVVVETRHAAPLEEASPSVSRVIVAEATDSGLTTLAGALAGTPGLSMGWGQIDKDGLSMTVILSALKEQTNANILSTPSLLTLDNQMEVLLISDPDTPKAAASLDVLSFMPVQSVDPFSGVIVFGYGTPPGGGKAYRATVYIQDPALDARSLNVALAGPGGPVAAGTQRAVEDAILNRARQMRIADGKL